MPIVDKNEQKEMGNTAKSSGGFKNFLYGAFRKNKPEVDSATKAKNELHEIDTKFKESGYLMTKKGKPTNKSKLINKRNITSGKIHLNRLDQGDVIDETSDIPTRESMYELLDQVPSQTSSHLESNLYFSLLSFIFFFYQTNSFDCFSLNASLNYNFYENEEIFFFKS